MMQIAVACASQQSADATHSNVELVVVELVVVVVVVVEPAVVDVVVTSVVELVSVDV